MILTRKLYHLALADFRERTRRYSFLIVLGLVGLLGYAVYTGDASLSLGNYRGVLNSAWIGAQMTLVLTVVLSLLGFYLVKNSIERDTQTGVGQIIATTPISRPAYLASKWLSHFLLLGVMVAILAAAALVIQLFSREAALDPWALISPFLLVALPCMGFTAGLAVLFESVPLLRHGLGNVIYFFLWIVVITGAATIALMAAGSARIAPSEPFGMGVLYTDMANTLDAQHPDYIPGLGAGGEDVNNPNRGFSVVILAKRELQTFQWDGIAWTLPLALRQWAWGLIGLALALGGAPFFERFDPSRGRPKIVKGARRETGAGAAATITAEAEAAGTGTTAARPDAAAHPRLTPLGSARSPFSFPRVFLAELRLLLKGWPWWWYIAAGGLIAGCAVLPLGMVKNLLLPVAWVWPILVWSSMGSRERRFTTYPMVYAAPNPLWRQIPATWLAGIVITAVTGLGGAIAFLIAGNLAALTGWLSAVIFIPSLALALGAWSGSNRLFEIVYMLWWYRGAVQHMDVLDFIAQPSLVYAGIGLALLAAALVGRGVQIQR
jgi:ABC-type transport system involved in multi-copper enzyme maturation permease subunit